MASSVRHLRSAAMLLVLVMLGLAGCKPPGFINKTKYNGEKYVNTCEEFEQEVAALIEANSGPAQLVVAEFDNGNQGPMFLEPGQFLQDGDTLYFRLKNDLEYGKYTQKGVAILLTVEYMAQPHLKAIEPDPNGEFQPLIIDDYYVYENSQPYFLYKVPVQNKVDGKQLSLKFAIVQYNKKGILKKEFCNSVEVPLGPLDPGCCTDRPWRDVMPRAYVQFPDLQIDDEEYRWKGFTGTMDLIFPMNSVKYNREKLSDVILNYIDKYNEAGYDVVDISMKGYCSQGGTVEYNQDLAKRRVETIVADLKDHFKTKTGTEFDIPMTATPIGEDWDRLVELTQTGNFTQPQRDEILAIANRSDIGPDEKEALFRKMKHWELFIDEVLVYCRHVFINFRFKYQPSTMYVEEFSEPTHIIAPELYNVATERHIIGRYEDGKDANKGLGVLNVLIDDNNNKRANLYAMRSTYHFALDNNREAISDIEAAMDIDPNNDQYGLAALAYKTEFSSLYSLNQRMELLNDYNSYVLKFPNDKALYYNRAVMMENVGFISGALAEYNALMADGEADAVAYNNRGVARLKTNRLVEAEVDFEQALKQNPELAQPHYNLAVLYAYKGHTDKVVLHLVKATELDPSLKADACANPVFRVMRQNPKFDRFECR